MKAWAYALGVAMTVAVLAPQLAAAFSFRRCAISTPAHLKGRTGDAWIYGYTFQGQESKVAFRSMPDPPAETMSVYVCPERPNEVSSQSPDEDVRRSISFLVIGLAVFPIFTGLYLPWAYRRNWLRALVSGAGSRGKEEGSLREP